MAKKSKHDKGAGSTPATVQLEKAGVEFHVYEYEHSNDHMDDGYGVEAATKLGVFSTAPAIRSYAWNLVTEIIATFVLVFVIFAFADYGDVQVGVPGGLGPLTAVPVALLVVGIGASLGGPTGYAINPARDLGPRIAHAVLPIKGKGSSDWSYAWVPVVGPLIGGALAAFAAPVMLHLITLAG